jgi:anti-anti-sigma factor
VADTGEIVVESRQADDVMVARIGGCRALFDERVIRKVRDGLSRLASTPGIRGLVIDFRDVTQFGSGLLAVLIDLDSTIRQAGGTLALCGLGTHLERVFQVTKLDQKFSIYPDEESALRGLRQTEPELATGPG